MKMLVALNVVLALSLSACGQSKASHRSGGGDRASSEDAEEDETDEASDSGADAGDDTTRETPPADPDTAASEPEDTDQPQTGAGDEQQPAVELCYKADDQVCQVELKILELMNKERAAPTKGSGFFGSGGTSPKAPLAFGKKLGFISRQWSQIQGQRGSIGHDGFPGARRAAFQQEFGQSSQMGAENVAMFGGGGSVEQVAQQFFQMWYSSSGHYQNMMGNFQAVGIGVARVNGAWWGTQIFGRE